MEYFAVKNFERFQHYRDRNPAWIKLYQTALHDYEMSLLTDSQRWHLWAIWLLAARVQNRVPMDPAWVRRAIGATSAVKLSRFLDLGLIEIIQENQGKIPESARQMLEKSYTREEKEEEKRERREETTAEVVARDNQAAAEILELKKIGLDQEGIDKILEARKTLGVTDLAVDLRRLLEYGRENSTKNLSGFLLSICDKEIPKSKRELISEMDELTRRQYEKQEAKSRAEDEARKKARQEDDRLDSVYTRLNVEAKAQVDKRTLELRGPGKTKIPLPVCRRMAVQEWEKEREP